MAPCVRRQAAVADDRGRLGGLRGYFQRLAQFNDRLEFETMVLDQLRKMSEAPAEASFATWLELGDAVAFLKDLPAKNEFVLYAGMQHAFLHTVLVPAKLVDPPNVEDLIDWNCNASSGWGVSYSFGKAATIWIEPPLHGTGSKILDQGEQLVFARFFEGRLGDKNYFEALQKLCHVLGIHFIRERSAYCRLDRRGDLEDVIRIIEIPSKGEGFGSTVITIQREALDEYMALTDAAAVLTFDFTRFRLGSFGGWGNASAPRRVDDGDLHYRIVLEPGRGSYMRGFEIVRSRVTKDDLYGRFERGDRPKQYESFIAYDWKNGVVGEISCAPDATANYFTNSDLPFEVSPAFFRPEVLLKYKADSDKYQLKDRSISCRGTWHLKTYDINEAGQVHTYICYLRDLTYEEQLHWKAYNEAPKAPISGRALKTDFEASWDLEYDPLDSLRAACSELRRPPVPWWTLRSEKLLDQVHYPVSSSADEWATEILQLDQLLVEGFQEKWLRRKAESLGRTVDPTFRSLKIIEECLVALGFEIDHAKNLTAPFHEVHYLRSKLKGHASGKEAIELKQDILAQSGSYGIHFRELCAACDDSLRTITKAFKEWVA